MDNDKNNIVGIYYDRKPMGGYLYNKKNTQYYVEAMKNINEYLGSRGLDAVFLMGQDSYIGQGQFGNYWRMDNETGELHKIESTIQPAIIYDKGHISFYDGCFTIFNHPDLARLGRNKWSQYGLFAKFMPETYIADDETSLEKCLHDIAGNMVVIKPLDQNSGNGIFIGKKTSAVGQKEFPAIVQEYHETSSGVPGVASGRHDIRLIIMNGKICVAAVREPKGDKLLANTHQGGSIRFFDPQLLPDVVLTMAKAVDEKLKKYGNRLYSSDFLFDGKKWYLIEINDRPGLPALYQDDESGVIKNFYDTLTQNIIKWSK
ncbi:MAG: hypothetical protein LBL08_02700 [Candidatus Nomurabacteria bacterium]|nr:hypothetical protein [Candidatus Nomurabacteria bacterium]